MVQLVSEGLHTVCENRRNFIQHTGTDLWCTPGVRFRAPPACSLHSSGWRYYPQALSVFPSMQLYTSFYFEDETEMAAAKRRIEMYVSDIHSWMAVNMLKLNTDKTELFYFHSRFRPRLQLNPIDQLGSDVISHLLMQRILVLSLIPHAHKCHCKIWLLSSEEYCEN